MSERGGAQRSPAARIVRAQGRVDGRADGVVEHEPVGSGFGERELVEASPGAMSGVVAEHGRQQCAGGPADDGGGVERVSRRAVQPAEVEAGELVDQRGNDRLVERQPGPRGQCGGGEAQRERVAVG